MTLFLIEHHDSYRNGYYLSYSEDIDIDIDNPNIWVVELKIDDKFRVYHFALPLGDAAVKLLGEFNDLKSAKHFLECQYRLYTGSYRLIETGEYADYHMPIAHRVHVKIPEDMKCEIDKPEDEFGDPVPQYLVIATNDGLIPIHISLHDLL